MMMMINLSTLNILLSMLSRSPVWFGTVLIHAVAIGRAGPVITGLVCHVLYYPACSTVVHTQAGYVDNNKMLALREPDQSIIDQPPTA